MSNEEILEEKFIIAHKNGVFDYFRDEVDKILKSNPGLSLHQAAHYAYKEFQKLGMIRD
jgi:hypothetical protein